MRAWKIVLYALALTVITGGIFFFVSPLAAHLGGAPQTAEPSAVSDPAPAADDAPASASSEAPPASSAGEKSSEAPTPEAPTPTPTPALTGKLIALTFDDGPHTPVTGRILDALEKAGGHATFFVVGNRVATRWEVMQRAVSLGCQIGSHTYSHANLGKLTEAQIRDEISKANTAIYSAVGQYPAIVRPPYGKVTDTVRAAVEVPMINWSVDTLDWKTRSAAATVAEIQRSAKDGAIVLMHDLYETTADAVEIAIPWLIEQGYTLVTVEELAAARGVTLEAGTVTRSIPK